MLNRWSNPSVLITIDDRSLDSRYSMPASRHKQYAHTQIKVAEIRKTDGFTQKLQNKPVAYVAWQRCDRFILQILCDVFDSSNYTINYQVAVIRK